MPPHPRRSGVYGRPVEDRSSPTAGARNCASRGPSSFRLEVCEVAASGIGASVSADRLTELFFGASSCASSCASSRDSAIASEPLAADTTELPVTHKLLAATNSPQKVPCGGKVDHGVRRDVHKESPASAALSGESRHGEDRRQDGGDVREWGFFEELIPFANGTDGSDATDCAEGRGSLDRDGSFVDITASTETSGLADTAQPAAEREDARLNTSREKRRASAIETAAMGRRANISEEHAFENGGEILAVGEGDNTGPDDESPNQSREAFGSLGCGEPAAAASWARREGAGEGKARGAVARAVVLHGASGEYDDAERGSASGESSVPETPSPKVSRNPGPCTMASRWLPAIIVTHLSCLPSGIQWSKAGRAGGVSPDRIACCTQNPGWNEN